MYCLSWNKLLNLLYRLRCFDRLRYNKSTFVYPGHACSTALEKSKCVTTSYWSLFSRATPRSCAYHILILVAQTSCVSNGQSCFTNVAQMEHKSLIRQILLDHSIVRFGILFIRVCSDIIFLLAIVLPVLCFTVYDYPLGIFNCFCFVQIKETNDFNCFFSK